MKKILFVAVVALLSALPFQKAEAQNWGIGLRGGWDYGLTLKKYMGANNLDFQLNIHNGGFNASGLYEWNQGLGNGFTLYYGFGASIGAWNNEKDDMALGLGIDGVIGVEWKIPSAPFALSLDWKPSFELLPDTGLWFKGFGFGVKYLF